MRLGIQTKFLQFSDENTQPMQSLQVQTMVN